MLRFFHEPSPRSDHWWTDVVPAYNDRQVRVRYRVDRVIFWHTVQMLRLAYAAEHFLCLNPRMELMLAVVIFYHTRPISVDAADIHGVSRSTAQRWLLLLQYLFFKYLCKRLI